MTLNGLLHFFLSLLLFRVGLEFFTEKTADVIFKKAFKVDNDKEEFYRLFEKEYIREILFKSGFKVFCEYKIERSFCKAGKKLSKSSCSCIKERIARKF